MSWLRRQTEEVAARLAKTSDEAVRQLIWAAYKEGIAQAALDLGDAPFNLTRTDTEAVETLVRQVNGRLRGPLSGMFRSASTGMRKVIMDSSAQVLAGSSNLKSAQRQAMRTWVSKGLDGFVDKKGRVWSMHAYANMTVRTAATHATVSAHANKLMEAGHDFVEVSDHGGSCKICEPWEGKVLSLSGANLGGHADGTYGEAVKAGLFHPNCKHRLVIWIPPTDPNPPATGRNSQ